VCYGGSALLLRKVLTRLAQEEISAQAFVPSLLNSKNPSFIQECAATTTRGCILVEEGTEGFNWSSEIASRIQGSSTQKPIAITRICPTMPILPTCKSAESAILPSAEKLVHAAFKLIS
jgi:pyruvate/2-oxoglutarate/acetoin dehydrogenase E1 component